jgi:peptidoglycan/xylan/chitin deacetylase (PgdA/CDA1 family)
MEENNSPLIAITFEAGGNQAIASNILDVLAETNTRATVFLLGEWVLENPKLVKRMVKEGHELGNHSYNHPDLTLLENDEVIDQLNRTSNLALRLSGHLAFPWLRPPFGTCDSRIRRLVKAAGYRLIIKDALDGIHWPEVTTPKAILNRTLGNVFDSAVMTYHLDNEMTLKVLPEIINDLKQAKYELTTLSILYAKKGYIDQNKTSHNQ